MKKHLYIFFSLVSISSLFAQERYKLYVEGEKQWAYKENYFTDFVYAFCTKDFRGASENPMIDDLSKEGQLKQIYQMMWESISKTGEKQQISLFFGGRKLHNDPIFFITFFDGLLKGKRKDAFFQLTFFLEEKDGVLKYQSIDITDKNRVTYKEPSVGERAKYQQDVMNELARQATSKTAKEDLETYINIRKRWKNLFIMK